MTFKPTSAQVLTVSYRHVDPYADVLPAPSPAILAALDAGYSLPVTCGLEPLGPIDRSADIMWSKVTGNVLKSCCSC